MTTLVTPDAVEAAAVVDALRRRVRDYTGGLDGSVVDQALEAAFTDVLADGVYVTALLNARAQQTLIDAAEAITAKTPHERRSQDFCAGMENAAHIVRARAATLTPKDTP